MSASFERTRENKALIYHKLAFSRPCFLDLNPGWPKLRWFAEKMPELVVIATGSLLDFALDNHTFSMPVGRIGYLYLEPFSFEEFLVATQKSALLKYTHDII